MSWAMLEKDCYKNLIIIQHQFICTNTKLIFHPDYMLIPIKVM